MIAALNEIEVLTLYFEDLDAARRFYGEVFGLETVYRDEVCSVMKLGGLMINLLSVTEAHTLVAPQAVAKPGLGSRALMTIKVENADSVCASLAEHGVTLINGPIDRPWGRRTAAFADPGGNIWEVAQELPG